MISVLPNPLAADMPLPRSGPKREALRVNGQFWTPDWVANAMVAYALKNNAETLFDPGVGAGAFFHAGRRLRGPNLRLSGQEVDPDALRAALDSGLAPDDLANVALRDFALHPPKDKLPAIVANPPYVRHHRLPEATKASLHSFARALIGRSIDGRAGLHVFFLLRCLQALAPGGRLAFIVSADICEGVFARTLWTWIAARFRINAVVTFAPAASPFPGVDTNAILLLIRNLPPKSELPWLRVLASGGASLAAWIKSGLPEVTNDENLEITLRTTAEAFATGLSRSPVHTASTVHTLGDYARVMRGIATGENDFFFMTAKKAAALGLPSEYFIPAIGRMRDVPSEPFTAEDLARLEEADRPTRLLSIGDQPFDTLPEALQNYLKQGEAAGLPASVLIATRKPWWRMERRTPPPFLFAYLGRRAVRFIRNHTDAVPLTCLLCIYPHDTSPNNIAALWHVLSDPRTMANLRLVGKSYGDGALKVEPRALQQLPLPEELLKQAGLLAPDAPTQVELNF